MVNSFLIRPYLLEGVALGGGTLDSQCFGKPFPPRSWPTWARRMVPPSRVWASPIWVSGNHRKTDIHLLGGSSHVTMSNKGFRVFFSLASYLLSEPRFGRISKPSNKYGCFLKEWENPQIIQFNRRFSIFFTIHFGGNPPIFGNIQVFNNHGDRKSPRPGVVGPLPNGRTSWLVNGGDPNYLLSRMILQVGISGTGVGVGWDGSWSG